MDNLLSKFSNDNDLKEIQNWKSDLMDAMIFEGLGEHEGIKKIIEKLKTDISEINEILTEADSKEIIDLHRDRLIDKKRLYQWFLSLFQTGEKIKAIEEKVAEEETFYNENKQNYA